MSVRQERRFRSRPGERVDAFPMHYHARTMAPLLSIFDTNWHPRMGDPSALGWFTTVAYFAVAALCVYAERGELRRVRTRRVVRSPLFWFALAAALVGLGFNKQLDLQSWFTQVGRNAAREGGWYYKRREVQELFILGIAAAGALVVLAALVLLPACRRHLLAFTGMVFLVCFVIIRAASFHHVDIVLYTKSVEDVRVNTFLELGAISLIACDALLTLGLSYLPARRRAETVSAA